MTEKVLKGAVNQRARKSVGKAESRREEILEAAGAVLVEWGLEKLTLDAVADRAGVSKGGLIYHFRSKDDLLLAMVERLMALSDASIEAELERGGEPEGMPGRYLRAYVRSCISEDGSLSEDDQNTLAVGTILLGAVTRQPRLLQAMSEHDKRWQQRIDNDGLDRNVALVLRTAADGFWMSMLLGFESGFELPTQRIAIRRTLLRMIDEAAVDATQAKGQARKRRAAR